MNVTNHQIEITNNITEEQKNIINTYWKLQEDNFIHMPSKIAQKFKIYLTDVTRLVASHSVLRFNVICTHCNKEETASASSQTAYRTFLQKKKFVCDSCQRKIDEENRIKTARINEENRIRAEEIRKKQILLKTQAVENKHWEKLNRFEFKLLHNIIFEKDLDSLINRYETTPKNYFWSAIFKMRDLYLIELEYRFGGNSVEKIYCTDTLVKALPSEDEAFRKITENSAINKENNELKFRLTKNPNPYSHDSPEYSGTFEFEEDILIKKGVEYAFAAWKRSNDDLLLTLIPSNKRYKMPKQKRVEW